MLKSRNLLYLLIGGAAFGLAFFASFSGTVAAPDISIEWDPLPGKNGYTPNYNAETGQEWAFVYVGSSTCDACNRDFLPGTVRKLKRNVREQARAAGHAFAAVGVAKDWKVEAGVAHLDEFGPFDEITAGRNWLNLGVLRYVWNELPGMAATPQVLVVSRRVETPTGEGTGYAIRNPDLLARKVGTREIRRWLEQGTPLPRLKASSK